MSEQTKKPTKENMKDSLENAEFETAKKQAAAALGEQDEELTDKN